MTKTKTFGLIILAASVGACTDGMIDGPGQTPESRVHDDLVYGTTVRKLPMMNEATPTPNLSKNMLLYYGGKVIPNIKVYNVLWSNKVSSAVSTHMAAFYAGVTNSAYFDWLSEYNTVGKNGQDGQPGSNQSIGRGTFGGTITITPSITSTSITDAQIQTEISNQINSGVLPQPDNNTYYAISFPNGTSINQGGSGSCVSGGFCAYHGTFMKSSQDVYYGVLPSVEPGSGCNTGCGNAANYLDNATSVASHEMIEATTDAEVGIGTTVGRPLAWYNTSQGEIGDICNAQQGSIVGGDGVTYVVQAEYDNVTGTCIVSKGTTTTNDFSVSLTPTTVNMTAGGTSTITVKTTVVSGTAQTVSLSVSGLPSGVTGSFSPASVTAGGSSTLTLTASASASGSSSATVTGTAGTTTHTATASVSVGTASGGETVLTNGVALSGQSGAKAAQAFYKIDVPSGATNLVISISGGTGDADLYTKFGAHPTLTSYDCRPYVNGNGETCTVAAPQAGTYYAMLNGYAAYSGVTIKASFQTGSPPPPPPGSCAHPICSTGAKLTSSCDPCATQICSVDSYCCRTAWDSICVGEVNSVCGQSCP